MISVGRGAYNLSLLVKSPAMMDNKAKTWQALNMRQPPGCSILELQSMDRDGLLTPAALTQPQPSPMVADFDQASEEELGMYREAFSYFDRRGDGLIRREDLGMALRAGGLVISNAEVQTFANKYDPDGTGYLDLKAYLCILAEDAGAHPDTEEEIKIGDSLTDDEIKSVLGALDTHGDGMIRMEELAKILATPKGPHRGTLSGPAAFGR